MDIVRKRFGGPDWLGTPEWSVRCPSGDMRLSPVPGAPATWQIQAASDNVLPWIYSALTDSTVGCPAATGRVSGLSTRHTLAWGYAEYARNFSRDVPGRMWLPLEALFAGLVRRLRPALTDREVARDLLAFAELYGSGRADAAERGRIDMAIFDEIVATLRALATSPIRSEMPASS